MRFGKSIHVPPLILLIIAIDEDNEATTGMPNGSIVRLLNCLCRRYAIPIEYPYASFYILTEDGNCFGADICDYDDVDDSYYLSYCCDLTDCDFIYFIVMYDGCGC